MPLWAAFVGGDATVRSPNLETAATINLYPETIPDEENAKRSWLVGTPGLKLLMTADTAQCRGMFHADARAFAVIGATLYEFDPVALTTTSRGTIVNDNKPVSIVSSGRGGEQLLIVGGGQVKTFTLTTNTLSAAITLPLTNAPVMAIFADTYFLLSELDSIRVWFSAINDGSSWSALDFFARSQLTDNLVGIATVPGTNRVYVHGSLTTNVFYNSGDATTPWVPYPGSGINYGLRSAAATVVVGDSVVWLSQNAEGPAQIVRSRGERAEVISTPAVSFALQGYSDLSDAEALVYQQEGHEFVAFTFPSASPVATWVYDALEGQWHQRNGWDADGAAYVRWRARGCCTVNQQTIVGDYTTGAIYQLDPETFADNAVIIRRLRRAPYLSPENQWVFLDAVELGMQSGVGLATGQGSDPTVQLRVSRDSGRTYGAVNASTGKIGVYNGRALWNRLGRVRLDRLVIEMTQTDPVRTAWGPGLHLRLTPGSGQL